MAVIKKCVPSMLHALKTELHTLRVYPVCCTHSKLHYTPIVCTQCAVCTQKQHTFRVYPMSYSIQNNTTHPSCVPNVL